MEWIQKFANKEGFRGAISMLRWIDRMNRADADWKTYHRSVWDLTKKVTHKIPGIEKRGFTDHHIDHIVSIWDGFHSGIPPHEIADISNLRMIPFHENMKKGRRSDYSNFKKVKNDRC